LFVVGSFSETNPKTKAEKVANIKTQVTEIKPQTQSTRNKQQTKKTALSQVTSNASSQPINKTKQTCHPHVFGDAKLLAVQAQDANDYEHPFRVVQPLPSLVREAMDASRLLHCRAKDVQTQSLQDLRPKYLIRTKQ
jgi:hypothetical protein